VGGAGDDAVFRQTLVLLERADAALSACTAAHPGLSAGLSADLSAGALGANMETCSPETWARFNCLSMVRRGGGGGGGGRPGPPARGGGCPPGAAARRGGCRTCAAARSFPDADRSV